MVEPSIEMKEAYQRKSGSFMVSSSILLENNRLEEAVSMAYYSMYYMVIALFFRTGIKCENHSAAAIILEELYGIDNTPMERAKEERIDKQYYVDILVTREDVEELIDLAEDFNAEIMDFTERLKIRDIDKLRSQFSGMI